MKFCLAGYGFVEFLSEDDADYSIKIMNMIKLFGKPVSKYWGVIKKDAVNVMFKKDAVDVMFKKDVVNVSFR